MKIQITKNEIIETFNLPIGIEIEIVGESLASQVLGAPKFVPEQKPVTNNTITVDFPAFTAKEIMEKVDNKAGDGKLLYLGFNGWYAKEDFYTKEKTRKGKRNIDLFLSMKGKSWTSSRSDSNGELVFVGIDDDGAGVHGDEPDFRSGSLGLVGSRSESMS